MGLNRSFNMTFRSFVFFLAALLNPITSYRFMPGFSHSYYHPSEDLCHNCIKGRQERFASSLQAGERFERHRSKGG